MKTNTHLLRICLTCCAISTLNARTWTEAQTGRTLEGDFVKVQDSSVVVRLANGYTTQLPLARLSEADQTFVKEQTAPYKYPREIEFRDTLPKTISGKIRRVELRGEN